MEPLEYQSPEALRPESHASYWLTWLLVCLPLISMIPVFCVYVAAWVHLGHAPVPMRDDPDSMPLASVHVASGYACLLLPFSFVFTTWWLIMKRTRRQSWEAEAITFLVVLLVPILFFTLTDVVDWYME